VIGQLPHLHVVRKLYYYEVLNTHPAFVRDLDRLFHAIEEREPSDRSAQEWLMRPDFDWSNPPRAVEWTRESAQKLAMAASLRLLQALADDADEEAPRAQHAMRLLRDAAAQEQAADVAELIMAFSAAWPLPSDAVEDIAASFVNVPTAHEPRATEGHRPELVVAPLRGIEDINTSDARLHRDAAVFAAWVIDEVSLREVAVTLQVSVERARLQMQDWATALGITHVDRDATS